MNCSDTTACVEVLNKGEVRRMKEGRGGKEGGRGDIRTDADGGRKEKFCGRGRRGNPYMEGQAREASHGRVQALGNSAM